MKFYKTIERGIVSCSNTHGNYFEKNFEFEDSIEIIQPTLKRPPNKVYPEMPYTGIDEKNFAKYIKKIILSYEQLADEYEKILDEWELRHYIEGESNDN